MQIYKAKLRKRVRTGRSIFHKSQYGQNLSEVAFEFKYITKVWTSYEIHTLPIQIIGDRMIHIFNLIIKDSQSKKGRYRGYKLESFTTSKMDRHLLRQKVRQKISVRDHSSITSACFWLF